MKVAVTGASGFVGRHVLRALQTENVETVAITRDLARLSDIDTSAHVVEMDIADTDADFFDLMGRPDVLIHLAWDGLPNYKALFHFESELPNQYRFLKKLVDSGLSSMLVTGTCFEYGLQSGELSESLRAMPNNPYGFAKDTLRQQLQYLQEKREFGLTWARLFYMYGEGQAANSLYPQLAAAVSRGEKVFNMSGGEQLRDYLHISEVAHQIVRLALARHDNETVNICSGRPMSVRRLIEGWIAENNWEIALNLGYYPYPDYEPMAFWGDRRKLDSLLRITHSLDDSESDN